MKSTIVMALAAVCLLATNAVGNDRQDEAQAHEKKNLERWQGTFELISMVEDGKTTAGKPLESRKLTVEGNKYHFQNRDFNERGSYRFDLTADPQHLDIIVGDGADKGKIYLAVFDATDQRVRICFEKKNEKRPTKMTGAKGSGAILEVWRKVSP
jgi:uncharacterized protein (TIGR03067 family)